MGGLQTQLPPKLVRCGVSGWGKLDQLLAPAHRFSQAGEKAHLHLRWRISGDGHGLQGQGSGGAITIELLALPLRMPQTPEPCP